VLPSNKIIPGSAKYFELRYLKNGCGKGSAANAGCTLNNKRSERSAEIFFI
jgi:hypothetical protein